MSFRTAKVRVRYNSGELRDLIGQRNSPLASTLCGFTDSVSQL